MKNVLKIKPFSQDHRGEMSHLLPKEVEITSAILIKSKKGSIRANHYHKKDTHYVYLLSGSFEYSEKSFLKKNAKKNVITIKSGDLVITSPNVIHAMEFLEDSLMIALTTEPRSQKEYEKDTVRVAEF